MAMDVVDHRIEGGAEQGRGLGPGPGAAAAVGSHGAGRRAGPLAGERA
jgi:hypothetical protein